MNAIHALYRLSYSPSNAIARLHSKHCVVHAGLGTLKRPWSSVVTETRATKQLVADLKFNQPLNIVAAVGNPRS